MATILDNYLEVVPLEPDFVPLEQAQTQALRELKQVLSEQEECHMWTSDNVQVIGLFSSNNQQIVCPSCGKEDTLSESDVFSLGEMLSVQPATEIELSMPCCSLRVVLASIDFGPQLKFARFGIKIAHRINLVDDTMLGSLCDILGCTMTQIHLQE